MTFRNQFDASLLRLVAAAEDRPFKKSEGGASAVRTTVCIGYSEINSGNEGAGSVRNYAWAKNKPGAILAIWGNEAG